MPPAGAGAGGDGPAPPREPVAGADAAAASDAPALPAGGGGGDLAAILTPTTGLVAVLAIVSAVVIVRRGWWRPDPAPRPGRRFDASWSLLFAVGLMLGTPVLATVVHGLATALAEGALPPPDTLAGGLALGLPVYGLMGLLVLAWWSGGCPETAGAGAGAAPAPAPAPGPAGPGRATLAGLVGLAATWPIVVTVTALAAALVVLAGGDAPSVVAHRTLARIVEDPAAPAAIGTIVMVIVLVPWLEEAIYRGMLQGGLGRLGLGRGLALLLASAIFALKHLGIAEPHAVLGLFVLGLGLGLVMERTGRLLAPVVMHAGFNAGNVAVAIAGGPAG